MAQFAVDAFTGTAGTTLTTYNAAWTEHTSYASGETVITDANRARPNNVNATAYYHSGAPATADYSVSADLHIASLADPALGVAGRIDTGANTFYMARHANGLGWQLYKFVAGTATQLGSTVAQTLTAGNAYNVKLKMVGSTIELFKELGASPTIGPITDTAITAAGKSGFRAAASGAAPTNTTCYHLDNFSADDVSAAFQAAWSMQSNAILHSGGRQA